MSDEREFHNSWLTLRQGASASTLLKLFEGHGYAAGTTTANHGLLH
jgi:hypothetical protein